jgi:hypothetical protein
MPPKGWFRRMSRTLKPNEESLMGGLQNQINERYFLFRAWQTIGDSIMRTGTRGNNIERRSGEYCPGPLQALVLPTANS